MKNITTQIALLVTSFGAYHSFAQTTNLGEITVMPNTILSVESNLNNELGGVITNDGNIYLKQNIQNDGTFGFNQNSGSLHINGSNPQNISGGNALLLQNLFLNNSFGEILLENELKIHGNTEFQSGVMSIQPNSGNLVFENEATQQSAWNGSYVFGKHSKIGNQSFVFPIGSNGYYRPLEIVSPEIFTDGFSCDYEMSNSDFLHPHNETTGMIEEINDSEFWTIKREQGNSDVIIGLSFNQDVTPSFILNNLNRVHVVRWDNLLAAWVSEGGIYDGTNEMIYTVAKVNDYGVYTLALMNEEVLNSDDIMVYNLITPNGNGKNDWMVFDGLENFEDNHVAIVNRWGETVFEMANYDNVDNVFNGYANKGKVKSDAPLPDGTYYYVITYTNYTGEATKKVGYLHISGH